MGVVEAYRRYKYRSLWIRLGHVLLAGVGILSVACIGYASTLGVEPSFSLARLIGMDESRFLSRGIPLRVGSDSVRCEVVFLPPTGLVSRVDVLGDSLVLRRLFDEMRYHSAYMPFDWRGKSTLLLTEGTLSLGQDTLRYEAFQNVNNKIK